MILELINIKFRRFIVNLFEREKKIKINSVNINCWVSSFVGLYIK